jgi:hypothetical protein
VTSRTQNQIKLNSSSPPPLRYNTNLDPKSKSFSSRPTTKPQPVMDIWRGKAKCRCERPVSCVYSYIMDWISFGAENHFYTTKTTPHLLHIYIYIYIYICISPPFYFQFLWVKGNSCETLSSVKRWSAGTGYWPVCYSNPTRGSRIRRDQNVQESSEIYRGLAERLLASRTRHRVTW